MCSDILISGGAYFNLVLVSKDSLVIPMPLGGLFLFHHRLVQ